MIHYYNCLWACAKCADSHHSRMRKVQSGLLLSIDTFYRIQWFWQRTAKALIRLRGCADGSVPSLSAYVPKICFRLKCSIPLQKHAYSNILKLLPPKNENFQIKTLIFFIFLLKDIDCVYSWAPPRRGGSNEYAQSMSLSRNKKNNVYPFKPQFTI